MPAGRTPIYVQIDIHAPLDRLWELTQSPELHQQWDLRFSTIEYLPHPDPAEPQQFLYATRIGFGLAIRGEGETVGTHDAPDGSRSSALKFSSNDPKSLIREGSGYWKYIPSSSKEREPSVRFLTLYDYTVRFGAAGRCFDRWIFRPLMGWATAWSFDRLRLWLERGIAPSISMRLALINLATRIALAAVWIYQGLVPKLLFRHADELTMLRDGGLSESTARTARTAIGAAEIALGLLLLLAWRVRWPVWLTLILMPLALLGVIVRSPAFLVAAFNPVSLNLALFALAVIALLIRRDDLPSASRSVRKQPKERA